MTKIKICGLTRVEDVALAIELGAFAVGFVLEPSSPRKVIDEDLDDLLNVVPPDVASVGVMGRYEKRAVQDKFTAIQAIGVTKSLVLPNQKAIAVFRPGSGDSVPEDEECDVVLFDAYSTQGFGGTGQRLDLDIANEAMKGVGRPIVLAGGLNQDNVAEAIRAVRPFAVDVSSGVESRPGVKDAALMREFFAAVAAADLSIQGD